MTVYLRSGLILSSKPAGTYFVMFSGNAQTIIHHDFETFHEIGSCSSERCYHMPIQYNQTIEQLRALITSSLHCHQKIEVPILTLSTLKVHCNCIVHWRFSTVSIHVHGLQFECYLALLNGHGFWLDGASQPQKYLDGDGSSGESVCGCAHNNTCR